jgi:hypothetical protein
MADPAIVACPAGQWTAVATNITTGLLNRNSSKPSVYKQTYRMTGNPAPTDLSDAAPLFAKEITEEISSSAAIDVYVWPIGAAGSVRVDV